MGFSENKEKKKFNTIIIKENKFSFGDFNEDNNLNKNNENDNNKNKKDESQNIENKINKYKKSKSTIEEIKKKQKIIINPNNTNEQYKVIRICGRGYYNKVYQCILNEPKENNKNKKNENKYFAIKTIYKKYTNNEQSLEHLNCELKILENLDSIYIIKVINVIKIHKNITNIDKPYIVYPYYNLDLHTLMKLTKYLIPIEFIKLILHDVYLGLNYLHKNKIIFRDLKPENIIIDFNTGICKLIDFGLAYKFNNDEEKLYKICGTHEYLSPEVIKKEGYDYDFDYWTFGIFAYELFYGFSPFTGKSQNEIFENILYQKIIFEFEDDENYKKKIIDEDLKDLIKEILDKDPYLRIEWSNIPFHPFFKEIKFNCDNYNLIDNKEKRKNFVKFLNKYKNNIIYIIDETIKK